MRWVPTIRLMLLSSLAAACAGEVTPLDPAEVLQLADSVVLAESDSLFLGRAGFMVVGPRGHLFLADQSENHIKEIDRSGRFVRVFGRRGRGPGEFVSVDRIAVAGDSLLLVWDHGQRHFVVFDLRTGEPRPSIPGVGTWPPYFSVIDDEIVTTMFDLESQTSLVRLSFAGTEVGREGVVPEVGRRHPMLVQGAFPWSVFTQRGDDVFAAYALSPAIHHWRRGERTATEIAVPAVRRRGVDPALFEEMLRDPARAGAIAFDRSEPHLMAMVAANVLALVTIDAQPVERDMATTFFVSVVDVAQSRTCVDLPVPTTPLPRPALAIVGDTLVVVQQGEDAQGRTLTTIRRYRIDVRRCPWTALPS